jgi:DNA segregation ATPase FtsK/SpoIIIE, S-DNA-T family
MNLRKQRLPDARRKRISGHLARAGNQLFLDPPPPPEFATQFLHASARAAGIPPRRGAFEQVAPAMRISGGKTRPRNLRVPIGRSGATKLQYLAIGKGTRQHALIAGKTGSGKSTLFHVIITNLALWCSPEQVEFYLVDFKKGVEFKCYASRRLPHARVVAIESDRAFGLSVLQRVDDGTAPARRFVPQGSACRTSPVTNGPGQGSPCRAPC